MLILEFLRFVWGRVDTGVSAARLFVGASLILSLRVADLFLDPSFSGGNFCFAHNFSVVSCVLLFFNPLSSVVGYVFISSIQ